MATDFPLIDIAGDRARVVDAVKAACTSVGFLAIPGHGVNRPVTDALAQASYGFSDLPMDEKLRVRRPKPEQNRGYIPPGDETLSRLRGVDTPPDLKELFAF